MRSPTQTDLAALRSAAEAWLGTPFADNSAVRGAGVCCHLLPVAIYRDAGWLPYIAAVPHGPAGWAAAHGRGIMEPWLDHGPGARWFAPVPCAQPGDLLGFRVGRCVHHLAVMMPDGGICHAVAQLGVVIAPDIPVIWRRRMLRIWRPRLGE
ncbi:MAG: hypothetical protein KF833_18700 [Verrucomicrobiae bacterium]|nr:hypothetical protein [Verrucomicrobiae bacterium]